jgi:hypothetical protein
MIKGFYPVHDIPESQNTAVTKGLLFDGGSVASQSLGNVIDDHIIAIRPRLIEDSPAAVERLLGIIRKEMEAEFNRRRKKDGSRVDDESLTSED